MPDRTKKTRDISTLPSTAFRFDIRQHLLANGSKNRLGGYLIFHKICPLCFLDSKGFFIILFELITDNLCPCHAAIFVLVIIVLDDYSFSRSATILDKVAVGFQNPNKLVN